MSEPSATKLKRTRNRAAAIRIRKITNARTGVDYWQVDVPAKFAGRRIQKQFATEAEASAEARKQEKGRHKDGEIFFHLTAQQRRDAVDAVGVLKDYDGVSLMDAVNFWISRAPDPEGKTVRQVADEMILIKKKGGASVVYINDLNSRLGRFADDMGCTIKEVDAAMIQEWLDALELSAQSIASYQRVIVTMLRYAKRKSYLPRDYDEWERLEKVRLRSTDEIAIYSPDDAFKLLNAASPAFVPALAVMMFAGLRSAEVERLDWKEIDLESGFITIRSSKAKTGSRRLVPIADNLRSWLEPHAKKSGLIWKNAHHHFYKSQQRTAARAGVKWQGNACRHSFISYRLAETQNINQTALEAGNSPTIIHGHYKALVRPSDAVAWFAIAPDKASNVVSLKSSKEAC